jgi:hypothetical protein
VRNYLNGGGSGAGGLIAILWAYGYFSLGARGPLDHRADLTTAIDGWIPFVGWMIWPYFLGIAFPLTPLVAVRCHHLFRLVAIGYVAVIARIGMKATIPCRLALTNLPRHRRRAEAILKCTFGHSDVRAYDWRAPR